MSWVSIDDAVGAVLHTLAKADCAGAMNVVAPGAVTNAEFAATLARGLHRPALFPVPGWLLQLVLGQMAVDTVLASTRARPERLLATGYAFRHSSLEPALRAMLAQ